MIVLYYTDRLKPELDFLVTANGAIEPNEGKKPGKDLIVGTTLTSFNTPQLSALAEKLERDYNEYLAEIVRNVLHLVDWGTYTVYRESKRLKPHTLGETLRVDNVPAVQRYLFTQHDSKSSNKTNTGRRGSNGRKRPANPNG